MASLASGDLVKLRTATGDKLHQPYRLRLIRGAHRVLNIVRDLGSLAEYVSGAGPTLMALIDGHEKAAAFTVELNSELSRMAGGWKAQRLRPDLRGSQVIS